MEGGGSSLLSPGLSLSEAFDLELLGRQEEGAEVLLGHVDLPVVDEAEDGLQVGLPDPLEVDHGVLVREPPQEVSEELAGGGEDDPVDLDLLLLPVATGQGQVQQLPAVPQVPHGRAQVGVQLVPTQTELFTFHVGGMHGSGHQADGDVLIFLFSQNYNMAAGSGR